MEINAHAPVKARHQIIINASPEQVWQLLSDIDQWPVWNPNIADAKLDGSLKPGSRFKWRSGGTKIVSSLQEVTPHCRLSWTGKVIGTQAIHIWRIEPDEQGTVVITEESFDGWLVRLSKGMMQKMLDTSLQTWLAHLKQQAEKTV